VELMDPIEEHKIIVSRRNVLPGNCPDLLHVGIKNSDQIGSFTLSMGHGNNEKHAELMFENGAIFLDITRQLYTSIIGRGPENFIKKTISGTLNGYSHIKSTYVNIFNVMRGKLSRDPGLVNIVKNFYQVINSKAESLVTEENAISVTELLEKIWREVGYGIPSHY
ncbi:unnamed protein product, partial [marine sediment metagenome]